MKELKGLFSDLFSSQLELVQDYWEGIELVDDPTVKKALRYNCMEMARNLRDILEHFRELEVDSEILDDMEDNLEGLQDQLMGGSGDNLLIKKEDYDS
jgi:hypothetical protein